MKYTEKLSLSALGLLLAVPMLVGTGEAAPTAGKHAEDVPAGEVRTEERQQAQNTDESERQAEIIIEYLRPEGFEERHISTVNVHALERAGNKHHTDVYRGITVSHGTGDSYRDGQWRDSDGWGLGYTMLFRRERQLSRVTGIGMDLSGGLLAYNHAFPEHGRAFNFMWRVSPHISFHTNKDMTLRFGVTWMHVSNSFGGHNPGYNGVGYTASCNWAF
ncbi:hypothetical protein TAMA11512_09570 [Selenomonas sp. TAMA-11512]|uniref:acyloxyacyl hydrolase n=1 Tax=Selenomonas sp. TAMA-11512 TaxID=3095337 RepID=UPI0030849E3B|nr:hypothetical protein TAMA11512_09570 [Selenomonas sp. TAMA-11512]